MIQPKFIAINVKIGVEYVHNLDLACEQHYHYHYEIYYLCEGQRTYIIDSTLLPCRAGDLILIRPNVLHGTTGSRYSRYVINFNDDFLNTYFSPEQSRKLTEIFYKRAHFCLGNEGRQLFADMLADYQSGDHFSLALRLGKMLHELSGRADGFSDGEKREVPSRIADIVHYIGENYSSISGIEDVADHFYFSKYHLSHLFLKHMGISVGVYIQNLKLANASRLLSSTKMPINEIATNCGFHSLTHFCNTFRKHVKMTPSEYRKNAQRTL